ncbi:MAG TPA: DUF4105 domain-containing protein [Deltaproteobacteria bacterium]|nr:DUF4105 domain-containing protein [Deltaproteobacteria bacterium]
MLSLLTTAALAAPPEACDLGGDAIYVLTITPGAEVTDLFGHTALLITSEQRDPIVYDWGHYAAGQLSTALDFLRGNPTFWLGADALDEVIAKFEGQDRTIYAQRLALPQPMAQAVRAQIDWRAPGDLEPFAYHWYRRNCTNEVMSLIDDATGGQISTQRAGPSPHTAVRQALRHAGGNLPVWLGLHLGCGRIADAPLTEWEAMFMPQTGFDGLASSSLTWPDGTQHPLVDHTCTLGGGTRGFAPAQPPRRDLGLLAAGLAGGGLVLAADRSSQKLALLGIAVLGGVLGILGSVVWIVGVFGMFEPVWQLHNLPLLSPLSAGLIPAALWARRAPHSRLPARFAAGLLALAVVGGLLAVAGGLQDRNLGVMGLAFPWLLASLIVLRPRRSIA